MGRSRMNIRVGKCLGILMLVCCGLIGCSNAKGELENSQSEVTQSESGEKSENQIYAELVQLAEGYRAIYENVQDNQELDSVEMQQKIVNSLGESGAAVVDYRNQIDMVNGQQVEAFCKNAKEEKADQTTLLMVTGDGGFVRYDLTTIAGNISVTESYLNWMDGEPRGDGLRSFDAYTWKYTDNGYLFLEEYQPVGYDGAPGQVGFRVKALDSKCRELNQKYVIPVGFQYNNLLITDWNEADYSTLDFYDLYERLYRTESGGSYPYESGYEPIDYEIPKDEFEMIIGQYFAIDHDTLTQNTIYDEVGQTYHYTTRGFADSEFPYEPYPEVVAYKENEDGTISLTIQAVWIWKERDQALTTELVVRPMKDGSFQYVSNHVTSDDGQGRAEWYTPRGVL